jgi:hypothetical protein
MLLQTNSYIVPLDKRTEHQRLLRRFRQAMTRLGCESFDVYEQVGPNWAAGDTTGRFVQIMRFRDRRQQQAVQAAERNDPTAQALIAEFCELINLPYQQQQGLFAVGFYRGVVAPADREPAQGPVQEETPVDEGSVVDEVVEQEAPQEEEGVEAQYGVPHPLEEAPIEEQHAEPPPLDEIDIEALAEEEISNPSSEGERRR